MHQRFAGRFEAGGPQIIGRGGAADPLKLRVERTPAQTRMPRQFRDRPGISKTGDSISTAIA